MNTRKKSKKKNPTEIIIIIINMEQKTIKLKQKILRVEI